MKPHFAVLTCNSAKKLKSVYKNLLCGIWGNDCVTLIYDNRHQGLADEAKSLGWDVEVFDWETIVSEMNNPGWTLNYIMHKGVVSPARRAAYYAMRKRGVRYFMELDDDLYEVQLPTKLNAHLLSPIRIFFTKSDHPAASYFKAVVERAFDLARDTGAIVAFVQSGETCGGDVSNYHFKPKCMNTFILDSENIQVGGGINEDVNLYAARLQESPRFQIGYLVWHHAGSQLRLGADYKGTYEKTFATVIVNPTAIALSVYTNNGGSKKNLNFSRVHHKILYDHSQPKMVYPVKEK